MASVPRRLCLGVLPALAAAFLCSPPALAQRSALFEDAGKPEWKEAELKLPPLPSEPDLIPLYVSPSATARFFIDAKSLSLADDGVVRYTLVVRGSGGAENISYEGIRCETAERRLYALGRPGGEWVRSRNDAWLRIEENAFNRQHAVLAKEYFCPPGMARPALAQIVDALRREAGLR